MKISAVVRALVAAGATPEMILAAVEAAEAEGQDALERRRASDRERQQRRRHVTSRDVTVTERDTPSSSPSPLGPPSQTLPPIIPQSSSPTPEKKRATRLSVDWVLPKAWGQWALEQDHSEAQIRTEADKFRDFWISKSGKDAAKLDWEATWRNWMRNCSKQAGGRGPPHRERTIFDAIDDFTGRHDHELSSSKTIDHDDGGHHPTNVHRLASSSRN